MHDIYFQKFRAAPLPRLVLVGALVGLLALLNWGVFASDPFAGQVDGVVPVSCNDTTCQ